MSDAFKRLRGYFSRAQLRATPEPFDLAFLRAYGWAHFGKSLTWYFSELLFAYFLTEVCGLTPAAMGAALAASLAFSAVVDVCVGKALATRLTSVQSACALQIPGALGSGITLVAFAATAVVPPHARLIYAIGCSCLFRLAFVFHDMPQNCILALVRASDNARVRLSATRLVFSGAASVIVAVAAAWLVGVDRGQGKVLFLIVSLLFAGIGLAGALLLGMSTPKLSDTAPPLSDTSRELIYERPGTLWAVLGLVFIVAGSTSVFGRLVCYFAAQALADSAARIAVLVSIAVGMISLQPAWASLLRRFGARYVFRASAATLSTGCVLFFFTERNVGAIALAGMIYGCGLGGLTLVLWSAVARLAASHAGRQGAVAPALGFGLLTAYSRLAAALSILSVGLLLGRIDYHSPEVASSWLLLAPMTGAPLVGGLICFLWASILPTRFRHSSLSQPAPPRLQTRFSRERSLDPIRPA
jgi:Na+/melibiose symporter-like transporter